MTDYQGNAKKQREGSSEKVTPDKTLEPVVTGKVTVQKKSLGRKFRDVIALMDFKGLIRYLGTDVIVPGARDLLWNTGIEGLKRVIYPGDTSLRHREIRGSRTTYTPYHNIQSQVSRGYGDYPSSRFTRGMIPGPRIARYAGEDFILSSRDDAEIIVSKMSDVLDQFDYVTVAQLKELLGYPRNYVDVGWGWDTLGGVDIRQIPEGWLLDFPPPEQIR